MHALMQGYVVCFSDRCRSRSCYCGWRDRTDPGPPMIARFVFFGAWSRVGIPDVTLAGWYTMGLLFDKKRAEPQQHAFFVAWNCGPPRAEWGFMNCARSRFAPCCAGIHVGAASTLLTTATRTSYGDVVSSGRRRGLACWCHGVRGGR